MKIKRTSKTQLHKTTNHIWHLIPIVVLNISRLQYNLKISKVGVDTLDKREEQEKDRKVSHWI